MDRKNRNIQLRKRESVWRRGMAVMLTACLMLTNLSFGSLRAYATVDDSKVFEVGANVTAVLEDGVLTLSGYGDTENYQEETAPFLEYAEKIHALEIGDGITYIGDYLFYGLGGLEGELRLPGSIVGFGDYAFSGDSLEHSPKFSVIYNEFEGNEVVELDPAKAGQKDGTVESKEELAETKDKPEESAEDQTKDHTESEDEINGTGEETAPVQEENGKTEASKEQTETSQETEASRETETSQETEASRETEAPKETEASRETVASKETEASRVTEESQEKEALKETEAPKETEIPEASEASIETKAPKEAAPDTSAQISAHSVPMVGQAQNQLKNQAESGLGADVSGSGDVPAADEGTGTDVESKMDHPSESQEESGTVQDSDTEGKTGEMESAGSDEDTVNQDKSEESSTENQDTSAAVIPEETAENIAADPTESQPSQDSQTEAEDEITKEENGNIESSATEESAKNPAMEPKDPIIYIAEQQIENPETLFYEGQSGFFLCSEDNMTFIDAAVSAGYEQADRIVTAVVDDGAAELELPALDDMVRLPQCPEELAGPYEEDLFFINAFAGWIVKGSEDEDVWEAGEYIDLRGEEIIYLYSSWKMAERNPLKVKTERTEGMATYSLVSADTGEEPEIPARYTFLYQWQVSEASPSNAIYEATASDVEGIIEEATAANARYQAVMSGITASDATASDAEELIEAATASNAKAASSHTRKSVDENEGWTDIEGAEESVYERSIEESDNRKQFRCMVTAVSMMRSRAAGDPVVMYSEPTTGAASEKTVYVDQTGGSDTNPGTQDAPFQSLGKAAEILQSNVGGDVSGNQIILLTNYQLAEGDFSGESNEYGWFQGVSVPVTICGITEQISITGIPNISEFNSRITNDFVFDSLKMVNMGHIYCGGHNLTIGKQVETEGPFYLYGSNRTTLAESEGNTILIQSGTFTRVIGYVRAHTNFDAKNQEVTIRVEGGTVDTLIAGSASGNVNNAKVKLEISGGIVKTLTGGCQGFQNILAVYQGSTRIDISGGEVTNLYGAGTGRNLSGPQFKGTLDINITGGKVTGAIYGSGSAASVVKCDDNQNSKVNINVSGGTVKGIFAAGKGGDQGVYDYNGVTLDADTARDFGSLQGDAAITISGSAVISGDIYASGEGYVYGGTDRTQYGQKNAYLDGTCTINLLGGTVKGSIFGGGKGIDDTDYSDCARVKENSTVSIMINGGMVEGDVYGGGYIARSLGSTSVNITNGTIKGNVYGGAYGKLGTVCVEGSSTVNMTGGWILGNLYGGSNLSNTGEEIPAEGTAEYESKKEVYDKHNSGLVFVNLVGGTVNGKVFGGGNRGIVNGSTHLHIGTASIEKCAHYSNDLYQADSPGSLVPLKDLRVGGSVYAGGDYGDNQGYNNETVTGYSHVYIDGTGYQFREDGSGRKLMELSGGVFGSGASCDAGSVRLVTLDHFGEKITADGKVTGTYGKLTSIQRADQVRLIASHVQLSGQSDAANEDKTALYSLNRIGDTTEDQDLGKLDELGNSLVLKDGSTLVLDSESIKVANFKSVDGENRPVGLRADGSSLSVENTILFTTGTTLHISFTEKNEAGQEVKTHGAVSGYTYMEVVDKAEAYIYARLEPNEAKPVDGGFAVFGETDADGKQIMMVPVKVEAEKYRYWKLAGNNAISERQTVLTARKDKSAAGGEFLVAEGSIELPPTGGGTSTYKITEISFASTTAVFADGAKDQNGEWKYASGVTTADAQKKEQDKIMGEPLKTFGLFMRPGNGFDAAIQNTPMVISESTKKTIIDSSPAELTNATPQVEFYLTYFNDGITVSQDLGSVEITAVRSNPSTGAEDTIILQIDLVTKASDLTSQTIDLYATQSGSYTGKWIIPAGADRTMRLTKVESTTASFKPVGALSANNDFAITMQPEKGLGWKSNDLLNTACDLKQSAASGVLLGSTDNRYEAPVQFILYNQGGFSPKGEDDVLLTFSAADSQNLITTVDITLKIHWEESVVSRIDIARGKYFDAFTGESSVRISGESSITSAFTIGSSSAANTLWLELQAQNGDVTAMPAGTKLTLLSTGSTEVYCYKVRGSETDGRILLSDFKQMWNAGVFSDTVAKNHILTVIMEFDSDSSLTPGEYSLHLRDNKSADTAKGTFTVDNTAVSVLLKGGGGLQQPKAKYDLSLTINAGNDTRLSKGTAAIFTLDDGRNFPDGTVFTHNGSTYTPMNGKVYIPLDTGVTEHTIVMDTTQSSTGLEAGDHYLTAKILSIGLNAGNKVISSDGKVTYTVEAVPQYGLKVNSGDARNVTAGSQLNFQVSYSFVNVGAEAQVIGVTARKKTNGSYGGEQSWPANGNTSIVPVDGDASGTQNIKVTVPKNTEPGTYRLVFKLGDKTAVYNIIVIS